MFIDKNLKLSFTPSDDVNTIGVICESDNSDKTDESLYFFILLSFNLILTYFDPEIYQKINYQAIFQMK